MTRVNPNPASPIRRQCRISGISRREVASASIPRKNRKLAGIASSIAVSKSIAQAPRAICELLYTLDRYASDLFPALAALRRSGAHGRALRAHLCELGRGVPLRPCAAVREAVADG